jgi:hypothetical protein
MARVDRGLRYARPRQTETGSNSSDSTASRTPKQRKVPSLTRKAPHTASFGARAASPFPGQGRCQARNRPQSPIAKSNSTLRPVFQMIRDSQENSRLNRRHIAGAFLVSWGEVVAYIQPLRRCSRIIRLYPSASAYVATDAESDRSRLKASNFKANVASILRVHRRIERYSPRSDVMSHQRRNCPKRVVEASASTSLTETALLSPCMECFRQFAAAPNSSASSGLRSSTSP